MANPIPLEDNFTDIIGKAQRGFKLTDDDLARRAEISVSELGRIKGGEVDEGLIRKIARSLNLGKTTLVESARKLWYPNAHEVAGLAAFNTPYEDMTVNSYLVWEPGGEAIAFDTGASCRPALDFARSHNLRIRLILLTHTHTDHIIDLETLRKETGAEAYVSHLEPLDGVKSFAEGHSFAAGPLKIEARQTSGHSAGGMTFVVQGLSQEIAVVGDSMFAGSMGGGGVSYLDALGNNRKKILTLKDTTVICPGHGPLTSVGEEKRHNPFFPEHQKN
jgi:hydroxyacylglutathione hydrolase